MLVSGLVSVVQNDVAALKSYVDYVDIWHTIILPDWTLKEWLIVDSQVHTSYEIYSCSFAMYD